MLRTLKRCAGAFVAVALMGGVFAGPAAAGGNTPAGTRRCAIAAIGDVDAGAIVKIDGFGGEKSALVAKALVDAKLKLCVKLDVDADIHLRVSTDVDLDGRQIVKIIAVVDADIDGKLVIDLKLIGKLRTSVGGLVVAGTQVVVGVRTVVNIDADAAVTVRARVGNIL